MLFWLIHYDTLVYHSNIDQTINGRDNFGYVAIIRIINTAVLGNKFIEFCAILKLYRGLLSESGSF